MSEATIVRRRGPSYTMSALLALHRGHPAGPAKNVLRAEIDLLCDELRRLEDRFLEPYAPNPIRSRDRRVSE
jgi:hypothetical protein